MAEAIPRARPLDPIPIEIQGEQAIVLRDPLGFSPQVVISPVVYFFLAHCDGRRSMGEIKLEFAKQFNLILREDDAQRILEDLEKHHLLESENFHRHRAEVIDAYRLERVRRASHQGVAYPDDPEALRFELDSYYDMPDGPGVRPSEIAVGDHRVVGLIAPHISIKMGGHCFAWAYRRVCESPRADTYVILGTGHAGLENCFAVTRKSFETPLGAIETDLDFVGRLERNFEGDPCAEEIHHREEHVIEFQAIFLQHALTGRGDFRIVPILCSFGHEGLNHSESLRERSSARPETSDGSGEIVNRFCEALRRTAEESAQSICFISSADLAHVGYRYGDPVRLTAPDLDRVEREDNEMLKTICSGRARAFLDNIQRDGNRRRICGFPCIYTMMRALDLPPGELLRYSQSAMDERNSTVSYASVVFCAP